MKNEYHAYRAACSPACAKAFIIEQRGADTAIRLMWQRQFMIDHGGWPHDKPIPRARAWEEIDGNIGTLPIAEWRATAGTVQTTIRPETTVPFGILLETETVASDPALIDNVLESFNVFGLARPPDKDNITTEAEFEAKYPNHISKDPGAFQVWLEENKDQLPTDDECDKIYKDFQSDRKDDRKRKAELKVSSAAASNASVTLPSCKRGRKAKKTTPRT